jgi:uncharacterized membrane protein
MKDFIKKNNKNLFFLSFVLLIGLFIRLYVFEYTHVINKDGILYINQAKAIYNGDWELAKKCGYDFISLYHLLIPLFYAIFGDWVISAKVISLLFGTATIIPLYLTMKNFFDSSIAFLTALIFAVSPFFVSNSVELIKDPIFWFLSYMGIFFFAAAIVKDKNYFLAFASFFYLIASLARFEAVVYLAASILYLLVLKERRTERILIFGLPVIITIFFSTILLYYKNVNLWDFYLKPRISHFINQLSEQLINSNFIQKSIYALKELLVNLLKIIYFPFLPFFIIGSFIFRKENKKNPYLLFFVFLLFLSFFALYLFYLKFGLLSSRYVALMLLPAFVFFSLGIKRFILFLSQKNFMQKTISGLLCLYIIVFTLPSNLKHKRLDKLVYKEIGEYISQVEKNLKVKVLAPDPRVMFYANLHSPEIECTTFLPGYEHIKNNNYSEMVKILKEKEIRYFVWQNKKWIDTKYDFLSTFKKEEFKEIKSWEDTNQGKLILFEIKNK